MLIRKYLLLLLGILLLAYWVCKYFNNQRKISNLHYGVKANSLRKTLHVPIIEDNMKPEHYNEAISGLFWKADQQLPSGNEVLHVWKNAIPFSDKAGLWKESDGFRKKYSERLFYQLNIHSEILGDTTAKRSGKLFFYDKAELLDQDLNNYQIDSVLKSWGLMHLVR
jgi:hypothetical protein